MSYALWLASWYPNALTPFDGDFIQRHARAASLFKKIIILHVKKDTDASITDDVKEVVSSTGNLTEIIIYYHPMKTGIRFLDKIISANKYKNTYRSILKKYFKSYGKPDIIHVQVAMKAGLQAMHIKKVKHIPYILTEHWSGYYAEAAENIYNTGWLQKRLTRSILKNASIVLPVAKSLEAAIKRLINVKTRVIPNVVNTSLFFIKPQQKEKFRFIHVSTMVYTKNAEGIISAARLLADEGVDFELIMIGNKSSDLIKLAGDLKLLDKHIFFKGEVSYEQVAQEMQSSSAFIMFSRYESLPCVILEALCCGLPVISSDVGGISEVINNKNGILVYSENILQLKDAMKEMISAYASYNKDAIATEAAEKYNYHTVGRQISDIYQQFIKR